jgi:hypothetical protein
MYYGFLNYHFIIVKNLYLLYTQKSTSFPIDVMKHLLQRRNIYRDPTVTKKHRNPTVSIKSALLCTGIEPVTFALLARRSNRLS